MHNILSHQFPSGLGVSALTLACAGRHMEVVKILRTLHAPIDPHQELLSPTPFMAACFNTDIDLCGYLIHM